MASDVSSGPALLITDCHAGGQGKFPVGLIHGSHVTMIKGWLWTESLAPIRNATEHR